MKVLFKEIRAGDAEAVARRLDANPSLVNAIAKAPPKKDDGQSTLQVAIKACKNDVAHLLLSRGADVNFVETSSPARWPVLHDAVRGGVFSSRFGMHDALGLRNTLEFFNSSFGVLKELIDRGADPNATDAYGNPPLMRAVLDARQIVYGDKMYDELEQDLRQVFDLLLDAGADRDCIDARYNEPLLDFVAGTSLERFLQRR